MTNINNCIEIKTRRSSSAEATADKGEREYVLHVPNNAPWGELFDASLEIHRKVAELVNEAVKTHLPQAEASSGNAPKD